MSGRCRYSRQSRRARCVFIPYSPFFLRSQDHVFRYRDPRRHVLHRCNYRSGERPATRRLNRASSPGQLCHCASRPGSAGFFHRLFASLRPVPHRQPWCDASDAACSRRSRALRSASCSDCPTSVRRQPPNGGGKCSLVLWRAD